MPAYPSFDAYLAAQSPRHQRLIRELRKFVKRTAPELQEAVKWVNGCWVKGKVPVSYVYCAPDYLQFGFFGGAALKDPGGLLHGDGRYVRHVKVRRSSDIDERAFARLLEHAVALTGGSHPRRGRSSGSRRPGR
jgi:hypothetical protein